MKLFLSKIVDSAGIGPRSLLLQYVSMGLVGANNVLTYAVFVLGVRDVVELNPWTRWLVVTAPELIVLNLVVALLGFIAAYTVAIVVARRFGDPLLGYRFLALYTLSMLTLTVINAVNDVVVVAHALLRTPSSSSQPFLSTP